MTLRLLTLPLVATLLTACGGSGQPATPAAPATPPTEVAAVKTPPPQYPIELACSGVGGTTTLKVVVGVEGKPTDVTQLTSSGNPQLDEQARTAVQGWQFNAASRNGQKIPATIQVPVSFNPPQPRPDECFAVEERLRRGG
ncbi:energy transducer TonB [Stenotrophomonas chelatiphaga]|jgi:protein TonB|uniref:Energy transducer TonB n=1 Tax=Stenotrophomonas chelatiphaga TaxID=517011 RepID=A0A0R0D0I8_9GAMM|nr:energy transducer TonB [Stenotrophomonas chelatiphaga]KRG71895.1 energy transducer TonB [Stenotrophomonas chelatiphaga]MCS4232057.1 protein TonB [Stenotrophomonas chelatiphaga]ROQ42547.1 protein TonB [Stenotrophomonas maltophilia]